MNATSWRLDGRTAIVTGASRGIGAAIAEGLATLGARVVLAGRKLEGLEPVVERIRTAGGEALAVPTHMGHRDQVEALVTRTVERFGSLEIVVNNAATNPVFGPVLQVEDPAFDKIMTVNLKGPWWLAKAAHPYLSARGGSIINIASVGGLSPEPFLGIYSVSKAALISLTKVLAKEWGPAGIRANVVCPGLIKTRFSQALWQNEEIVRHVLEQIPLGRLGEPVDVVGVVLFLASDAAAYVNGAVFTVDGGMTA